jgi:hypothetical protein
VRSTALCYLLRLESTSDVIVMVSAMAGELLCARQSLEYNCSTTHGVAPLSTGQTPASGQQGG